MEQLDLAMFTFVLRHGVPDKDQDLAVGAAALVVRHDVQLVQQLLVDADG